MLDYLCQVGSTRWGSIGNVLGEFCLNPRMCFKISSFAQFNCMAIMHITVLTSCGDSPVFHLQWEVRANNLVVGPSLSCKNFTSLSMMSL